MKEKCAQNLNCFFWQSWELSFYHLYAECTEEKVEGGDAKQDTPTDLVPIIPTDDEHGDGHVNQNDYQQKMSEKFNMLSNEFMKAQQSNTEQMAHMSNSICELAQALVDIK